MFRILLRAHSHLPGLSDREVTPTLLFTAFLDCTRLLYPEKASFVNYKNSNFSLWGCPHRQCVPGAAVIVTRSPGSVTFLRFKFQFIAPLERWHPMDARGCGLPHQPAGWFAMTCFFDAACMNQGGTASFLSPLSFSGAIFLLRGVYLCAKNAKSPPG